jgi:hypothetical protein
MAEMEALKKKNEELERQRKLEVEQREIEERERRSKLEKDELERKVLEEERLNQIEQLRKE